MSITYRPTNTVRFSGTTFTSLFPSYTHSSSVTIHQGAPLNGYYIDHVRLYVLQQVLALQSELMNDLMEARSAQFHSTPAQVPCRDCPWDEAE